MLVATFACGLRDDSRVKMRLTDTKVSLDRLLMARIADDAAFLSWTKTKDAQNGHNRPKSILSALMGNEEREFETYTSPDDFKAQWAKLTGADNG